jgi:signal transduction histidine kinase
VQREKPLKKQAPEQPRQNSHMQEEARLAGNPAGAVGRQAAAGDDHMDVGMVGERRAPGVQHRRHAEPRAKASGISGKGQNGLGRGTEKQVIDRLLVPEGDLRNPGREGEYDVEILYRQQVRGARGHPVPRRRALTFGAMPVLAGVVGDVLMAATGAPGHMPAESLGPAGFDGRHHLELGQADMPRIGPSPRRAMGAEDVSQFQRWPGHAAPASVRPDGSEHPVLDKLHLLDPRLLAEAALVLDGLAFSEREVAGQSKRWFKRRIQPCLTPDGIIDGVVMTFVDITDQRQIYAALTAAENRAQLATVAKFRFLAVASHDLRQPLQTMVILQALLAGCVTGNKPKDLVRRMAETLGSMSRMLDVLLDINQIEAGVVEPNISAFPVMSLLQDLFDEFSTTATYRGVDMLVVRSSRFVRSDPVLLEQMLRNLVSNALKYAPGKRVLIGCRLSGSHLMIEVRDSGIGIPSEEMGAIFDEYYQISADAPGLGQGMGLGLNIVQRLGAILGHPVSAGSVLGKGSHFTVRVPCAVGPAVVPVALPSRVAPKRTGGTGHILVVEDDLQVGNLLELLLVDQGHRVTMVETAAAALDLIAKGLTPDLLLSDYNLPGGLDGLTLARNLRESSGVPAILLSGDITTEAMRRIAH